MVLDLCVENSINSYSFLYINKTFIKVVVKKRKHHYDDGTVFTDDANFGNETYI